MGAAGGGLVKDWMPWAYGADMVFEKRRDGGNAPHGEGKLVGGSSKARTGLLDFFNLEKGI